MHDPADIALTSPAVVTEHVAPLSDSKEMAPPDEPNDDEAKIVSVFPATRNETGASTLTDWLALLIVMDISVDPAR
jgi:hypothetical protein